MSLPEVLPGTPLWGASSLASASLAGVLSPCSPSSPKVQGHEDEQLSGVASPFSPVMPIQQMMALLRNGSEKDEVTAVDIPRHLLPDLHDTLLPSEHSLSHFYAD